MRKNRPPSRSTCEYPQAAHIGIHEGSDEKEYLLLGVLTTYTEEIQTLNVHGRKGGSEYSQQE
jgi:hypothetical protein